MSVLRADSPEANAALERIERRRDAAMANALRVADEVIEGVRMRGDAYVREQVQRFDGVLLDELKIAPRRVDPRPAKRGEGGRRPGEGPRDTTPNGEITQPLTPASRTLSPTSGERDYVAADLARAIDLAISRIESFHRQQMPSGYTWCNGGTNVIHRVRPLRRVGVYVPGGRAVYLSTLIMTAVPARLAGVRDIVVATTPAAADRDELHYACDRLGIHEIYRAGGAAGIAALAFGTETIARVDKIVGPGNQYVTAAKARLIGNVGIDMLAGPTELVVIADDTANVDCVASDLRAQAEHGPDSAVICVWIGREIDLPEATVNIVAASAEQAIAIANRIAPEHLSIQARDAQRLAMLADNAGAIFCGSSSPVAAGDYIAGPNHVLPTGGSARFSSPLGVYDFVKRSNIISISDESLQEIAPFAQKLAEFEGLPMHAKSLAQRSLA